MKIWLESSNGKLPELDYFWGMDVTGFNSEEHCQKCFIGRKFRELHHNFLNSIGKIFEPSPAPEGYFYLCSSWNDDKGHIHLVLKENSSNTEVIKSSMDGFTICATGVDEIFIDHKEAAKLAREKYPDKNEKFWDCWNFQFGMTYFGDKHET